MVAGLATAPFNVTQDASTLGLDPGLFFKYIAGTQLQVSGNIFQINGWQLRHLDARI